MYCSRCYSQVPAIVYPDTGYICCAVCHKIIDQEIYSDCSSEPTFIKDKSGQRSFDGQFGHTANRFTSVDKQVAQLGSQFGQMEIQHEDHAEEADEIANTQSHRTPCPTIPFTAFKKYRSHLAPPSDQRENKNPPSS